VHKPRPGDPVRVAIIGLGPWGLAALERLVAVAGRRGRDTVVIVADPGLPGTGIFAPDTPDYLPLNTPCGQHVIFPQDDAAQMPPYARSLYDWAEGEGYTWFGTECRKDPGGTPITRHDFLPRRLMGEWLNWSYEQLAANRPACVSIHHHRGSAVDVEPSPDGGELVHLDTGLTVPVDYVILTTGHTATSSMSPCRASSILTRYRACRRRSGRDNRWRWPA
jgi:uncharacterized NAD(P)/FAD-binding protein YdhS